MAVFTAETVGELPTPVALCNGSVGRARAIASKKVTRSKELSE